MYSIKSGGYVGYTGIVRQPAEKIAKSACTHSARLAERMPTASPFLRPKAMRPVATSRTVSPTWRQVTVCHWPPCLNCWAGLSALRSTRSQNIFASVPSAMVSPLHLCAKFLAQNLADRALGQRAHEAHLLGALEAGQAGLAEGHDLLRGGGLPVLEHYESRSEENTT